MKKRYTGHRAAIHRQASLYEKWILYLW